MTIKIGCRGQASVVGGLFTIAITMLLLMAVIYVQGKYLLLFKESFSKMQNRLNNQERLVLYVNYTRQLNPSASSSTSISVIEGKLVSGNVRSLNRESDNDFLVIETAAPEGEGSSTEEVELVKNGEFNEGFRYWIRWATSGRWRVVRIGSDYVAEHSAFVWFFPVTATLTQYITITEDFDKVTLKFDYYMYVSRIGTYVIKVYVNRALVYSRVGTATTGWVHVSPIDVTKYIVKGRNILRFYVRYSRYWRGYIFRLDSVSLKGIKTIPPPTGKTPITDVRFSISGPRNLVNSTFTLRVKVSGPCDVSLYAFDFNDRVWRLLNSVYSETDVWFYLNASLNKSIFFNRGVILRLYGISHRVSNFTLYVDYLGITFYEFTPNNVSLYVVNNGSTSVYVISVWLINSTYHHRISVERFLDAGMKLEIPLSQAVSLSPSCKYTVRVWTKVRAYEIEFKVP